MSIIGKTITGYKILKRIGKGGMGLVYLAEHTTLDKQAAIKVIDKKLIPDNDFQIEKRFKREAVLHSKLGRHPKIIELFNYIHEDNYFYILMEYFESVELAIVIGKQTGPIPHKRAIPIFKQILQGIGHAHKRGIIHRDIKPSNILIDKDDKIKIVDFGIAIEQTGSGRLTQKSLLVGSPMYMSPEHILEMDLNNTADIYLLGLTFYEMLAGKHPFDVGKSKIKKAQISEIPKDPRVHYKDIPEHIVNAIMMALNKNPEDRQKSCDEFLQQLEGKSDISSAQIKKTPVKKPTDQQKPPGSGSNSILNWVFGFGVFIFLIILLRTNLFDNVNEFQCYDDGTTYYRNKNYQQAINSFTKCLNKDQNDHKSRFSRSWSHYKLGDYSIALTDANKLIKKRGNADDYNLRGWVHYGLSKNKKAITDFNIAIAKGRNDSGVYNGRAWSYYHEKKYSKASTDFNKAISISPKFDNSYYGRALTRWDSGNRYGAMSDMSKAIKLDSLNSEYFIYRGLFFQDMNNLRNACKDWKKAKFLESEDADYYIDKYCK
jgi:serine/threonine protein kinase